MSFNLIVVGYSFVFISILSSFKFTLCQLQTSRDNDNPVQQEVANFAHESKSQNIFYKNLILFIAFEF